MSARRLTVLVELPTSSFPVRPAVCGQTWLGNVVDPEPVYRRTVAMTWADPCKVEVRPASALMRLLVGGVLNCGFLRFFIFSPNTTHQTFENPKTAAYPKLIVNINLRIRSLF